MSHLIFGLPTLIKTWPTREVWYQKFTLHIWKTGGNYWERDLAWVTFCFITARRGRLKSVQGRDVYQSPDRKFPRLEEPMIAFQRNLGDYYLPGLSSWKYAWSSASSRPLAKLWCPDFLLECQHAAMISSLCCWPIVLQSLWRVFLQTPIRNHTLNWCGSSGASPR